MGWRCCYCWPTKVKVQCFEILLCHVFVCAWLSAMLSAIISRILHAVFWMIVFRHSIEMLTQHAGSSILDELKS